MKRFIYVAIAAIFLLLAISHPVKADSPAAKYSFSSTIYDGQAITGQLFHAEGTATANSLEVKVTFFITGNYYMATVGEADEEGRFEVEGVGPIEYITAVALGSDQNGERKICGAVDFEVINGQGKAPAPIVEPTKAPSPEPTEKPTETPTPAPTEQPTEAPTPVPTEQPTEAPTPVPTEQPTEVPTPAPTVPAEYRYVLNKHTMKFHRPGCSSVKDIREENKAYSNGTREEIILQGFDPCKRCKP